MANKRANQALLVRIPTNEEGEELWRLLRKYLNRDVYKFKRVSRCPKKGESYSYAGGVKGGLKNAEAFDVRILVNGNDGLITDMQRQIWSLKCILNKLDRRQRTTDRRCRPDPIEDMRKDRERRNNV